MIETKSDEYLKGFYEGAMTERANAQSHGGAASMAERGAKRFGNTATLVGGLVLGGLATGVAMAARGARGAGSYASGVFDNTRQRVTGGRQPRTYDSTATRVGEPGGTHEQHVRAGQQSHKNDDLGNGHTGTRSTAS